MIKASAYTAWGLFFTAAELAEIPEPLRELLMCTPWKQDLCKFAAPGTIVHATPMFAPNGMRLPRFISWVLPFRYVNRVVQMGCSRSFIQVPCLHPTMYGRAPYALQA